MVEFRMNKTKDSKAMSLLVSIYNKLCISRVFTQERWAVSRPSEASFVKGLYALSDLASSVTA